VEKYVGDGVLVYFGHPQAPEGHAEQAVRAGLALTAARACANPSAFVALRARLGDGAWLSAGYDLKSIPSPGPRMGGWNDWQPATQGFI
jgi:hypothetical protein